MLGITGSGVPLGIHVVHRIASLSSARSTASGSDAGRPRGQEAIPLGDAGHAANRCGSAQPISNAVGIGSALLRQRGRPTPGHRGEVSA
jgi:hypothetical protein